MEIQSRWSIDDALDAHLALDYFAHMEWLEMRSLKRGERM